MTPEAPDIGISVMSCRRCGGVLMCEDEQLKCQYCQQTFENWDDAIGDPWDEPNVPDEALPLNFDGAHNDRPVVEYDADGYVKR